MALGILPLGPQNKGWGITKSPITSTRQLTAASGVEYRSQNWQIPRWKFGVPFTVLREFAQYTEFNTLVGFILTQAGMFNNWLYDDPDDDTATSQNIGVGNGNQQNFPLVTTIGGYAMPINYVNSVTAVYIGGVAQSSSTYSVIQTGYYGPDTISFNTPPADGAELTADFTFYFVCRFTSDTPEFQNDFQGRWQNKKLEFESVK